MPKSHKVVTKGGGGGGGGGGNVVERSNWSWKAETEVVSQFNPLGCHVVISISYESTAPFYDVTQLWVRRRHKRSTDQVFLE